MTLLKKMFHQDKRYLPSGRFLATTGVPESAGEGIIFEGQRREFDFAV